MSNGEGRTAVVTGAGNGIGLAAAGKLAECGFQVVATDRDEASLQRAGLPASVAARRLDVTDGEAVKRLAAEFGDADVLVNCAGIVQIGAILDATDVDLDLGIDVNFRSMWRTVRAFLPGMVERRSGAIVNVSSIGSSVKAMKGRFIYSATKAAVIGLTKSVAADYADCGVCCNAVCPGPVDSPSMRDRLTALKGLDEARQDMAARVPLGRMGTVEEVGELIAYLAGARFTTGQIHVIDGGMTG